MTHSAFVGYPLHRLSDLSILRAQSRCSLSGFLPTFLLIVFAFGKLIYKICLFRKTYAMSCISIGFMNVRNRDTFLTVSIVYYF
jgi:hypothetical protein